MQQTQWSPRTGGIVACAIFGAAMAIGAVTVVTDTPGRVLAGVAGIGLLTFASMSWRARPKLAITDAGLVTRGWFSIRVLQPADIGAVRITEFRRIGRKVRMLEIDVIEGDRLLVFTRWDLGVDPLEVLDALTAAGYVQ
jgi:hypothetical protein